MSKLILLLAALLACVGCDNRNDEKTLRDMVPPIVLESERSDGEVASVAITDATGRREMLWKSLTSLTISNTCGPGDTIIYTGETEADMRDRLKAASKRAAEAADREVLR